MKTVPERLHEAAELFATRNADYTDTYKSFGPLMQVLFPTGMGEDLTPVELGRLVMISHLVTKLSRYCRNFRRGGHADSLMDLSVYATMLAELDDIALQEVLDAAPGVPIDINVGQADALSPGPAVQEIRLPCGMWLSQSSVCTAEPCCRNANGWLPSEPWHDGFVQLPARY